SMPSAESFRGPKTAPALLISTFTVAYASRSWLATPFTEPSDDKSASQTSMRSPLGASSFTKRTAASARAASRQTSATQSAWRAKCRAVHSPRPEDAPVTIAVNSLIASRGGSKRVLGLVAKSERLAIGVEAAFQLFTPQSVFLERVEVFSMPSARIAALKSTHLLLTRTRQL